MKLLGVSALTLVLLAGSNSAAQQWAVKMFETTAHDFGTVARGAKAEFEFRLKNIYVEEVHIAGVRSSCGCTTPRIKDEWLKTYQVGAIVARFNTPNFTGRRAATLTVKIDEPRRATVRLHVKGRIRSDVVLEPGSVRLGNVEHGTAVAKSIRVNWYGGVGRPIPELKSANPHLSGRLVESRSRWSGRSYRLEVRLEATAPPGYIKDHLMLLTSDRRQRGIPVPVEGHVLPTITVSPASLFLGALTRGEKVSKRLMVRSKRPFRITAINSDGEDLLFELPANAAPRPFYLIPVTFVAGEDPGKVVRTIRIETDREGAVAEVCASALVRR